MGQCSYERSFDVPNLCLNLEKSQRSFTTKSVYLHLFSNSEEREKKALRNT